MAVKGVNAVYFKRNLHKQSMIGVRSIPAQALQRIAYGDLPDPWEPGNKRPCCVADKDVNQPCHKRHGSQVPITKRVANRVQGGF